MYCGGDYPQGVRVGESVFFAESVGFSEWRINLTAPDGTVSRLGEGYFTWRHKNMVNQIFDRRTVGIPGPAGTASPATAEHSAALGMWVLCG